jgi:hypothetical protein
VDKTKKALLQQRNPSETLDVQGSLRYGKEYGLSPTISERLKRGIIMKSKDYCGYFLEDALFMATYGPTRLPANQLVNIYFKDDPAPDKDISIHDKLIISALDESMREAADPNAKRYTHEEVMASLNKIIGDDLAPEPSGEEEDPRANVAQVEEFKVKFNDRIPYWQKFDDDFRALFTIKFREDVKFGIELYASLVSVRWYHESDPNKTECGAGSARNAGAFISSMLCYSDYLDWYFSEHSGKVSEEIATAMAAKGWQSE